MVRPRQDMDFVLLEKALDEIVREKLATTVYYHLMGEAVFYPRLEDAVLAAKDKGLKVSITTNGAAFSADLLNAVSNAGVDEIVFSVQTPDKKSFGLRRASVPFDAYRANVCQAMAQALAHGGPHVVLSLLTTPASFLLLPTNRYQIIRTKKELMTHLLEWTDTVLDDPRLSGLKARVRENRQAFLQRLGALGLAGWNKFCLTPKFSLESRMLGDWVHRGLTDDRVVGASIGSCEGLQSHMGILSNGEMVFCCVDYDGKTRFGNIRETGMLEALMRPSVQDVLAGFRKWRVKHPYCKRCLGDVGLIHSLARQVGSVVYFRIYRPYWEGRRHQESSPCP